MGKRLVICALVLSGCGSNGGNSNSGDDGPDAAPGEDAGVVADAFFDRDAACASTMAEGTLVKAPVDIIFVIDNSGSMTAEIIGVEKNVNDSFAQIIGASGLDYRVIMLSTHGSATASQSICVAAPLSGHMADPTTKLCKTPINATPINSSRFFHYSTEIGSTNSFRKILDTYNVADPSGQAPTGWSSWLRADAVKTFIEITDDNQSSTTDFNAFETQLFAKTPKMFGTAAARNYVFHSIAGVAPKATASAAYASTEPLVTSKCSSAVNTGGQYQNLSIATGGLRFPVCDPDLYSTVFQTVAQGVISGAQIACEFPVPMPTNGQQVDLASAVVDYIPSDGSATRTFTQVADAASCAPDKFYIENGKIVLCPDTCTTVKTDVQAKVQVYFACSNPIF